MRKRHNYENRLKYMHMLEEGYSMNFIHTHYGINNTLLLTLWEQYKVHGASALGKKANVRICVQEKIMAIEDFEKNDLSLDEVMLKYNVSQSMSRKGNCLDNSMMENFFGIMKSELLYLQEWDSIEQFKVELRKYIHYYNYDRIKLRLKGKSPVQYRTLSELGKAS